MKYQTTKLFLMASLSALAAGCAGAWNGSEQALTIAEEHPITVDSQVVTMTLDIDPSRAELNNVEKARLRAFADAYLTGGHGSLTVTAPSGAGNDRAGQDHASAVRKYLNEAGVDWSAIAGGTYRAGGDSGSQVILSYTHYVATASACGVWTGLRSRDYGNLRSPNFGCATQSNLAAMIADPRDLIQPADDAPPDAAARIRGVRAYREGEVTSSQTDSAIKAEVAE